MLEAQGGKEEQEIDGKDVSVTKANERENEKNPIKFKPRKLKIRRPNWWVLRVRASTILKDLLKQLK